MSIAEAVAHLALSKFEELPKKCLPRTSPDGRREWTILSAVVLVSQIDSANDRLKLVSLGTGTKCLPAAAIPKCNGAVLHDCHAEVLALRGFNRWVLNEIEMILKNHEYKSDYLEPYSLNTEALPPKSQKPFRIKRGKSIYLFTTEAPCGDASMELLMESMPSGSSLPWSSEKLAIDLASGTPLGRGHFSLLGAMRRKPSRADAEASLSMSCTDKIALKQFTGLLSFPTDVFVEQTAETFLTALVTYENCYNKVGYDRAFSQNGRLAGIDAIEQQFFKIDTLDLCFPRFQYEKQQRSTSLVESTSNKSSNLACIWIAGIDSNGDVLEILINGVKQGFKQFDDRNAKQSVLCRQQMTQKGMSIMQLLGSSFSFSSSHTSTYSQLKRMESRRRRVDKKNEIVTALGGWRSISHNDDFGFCGTI